MTEETKEETKEEGTVEVPKKFAKLVSEIEEMSVLDLSELVKILEEKFGVSAAAPAAAAAPGAGEGGAEEPEAKSSYNIEVTDAGAQKIAVIKAVREITEIGLKDAKDLVDKAPAVVKENVPAEEAEEMKKKLEEAGASVELK
jgi:large subunit ribosomal protein L7/L12